MVVETCLLSGISSPKCIKLTNTGKTEFMETVCNFSFLTGKLFALICTFTWTCSHVNVVVHNKCCKYFSFWSIFQACVKRINGLKSREEEVKILLDSEVSDKSEEVEHQQLHVEQLKEIELLKKGNYLKLYVNNLKSIPRNVKCNIK